MRENDIASLVIGNAIEVHKTLGPGLLESSYTACLYHLLCKSGLKVERQKAIPLIFEDEHVPCGYRLDLLVEDKVVVEAKSVEALNDIHLAQVLTYLKLGDFQLGLLINFNVLLLKHGIRRVVNNLVPV